MLNRVAIALSLLACTLTATQAQADAAEGEKLFGQCLACHQIGESAKHLFGPALNGISDQPAGAADDFAYSGPFEKSANAGLVWDDKSLHQFLKAPLEYIPGTKMAFPGVADKDQRTSIIAYLKLYNEKGERIDRELVGKTEIQQLVEGPRKLASEFEVPEHGVLHLGRKALDEEVAAWDIDIRHDGLGLPVGSGNVEDGEILYENNCAACHGSFGEGTGRWPVLAGGLDTLTEERPEKTIGSYWPYLSTVFDYIRRAMPFGNARSLSDDDVYAITAYLLYLNDIEDEDFELNAENFTSIRMPNEANFIADNRKAEAFRSTDEKDVCMSNCMPTPARITQKARVLDVTPDEN